MHCSLLIAEGWIALLVHWRVSNMVTSHLSIWSHPFLCMLRMCIAEVSYRPSCFSLKSFLSSLKFHKLTAYLRNALSLTKQKQQATQKREKEATVKEGQKKWQVSLLPIIIIYVCTLYLLIPHSPDIGQLSKGTDSFLISFIRKEQWSVVYR